MNVHGIFLVQYTHVVVIKCKAIFTCMQSEKVIFFLISHIHLEETSTH